MIEKTETIHNFNQQCFIVTGGAQGLGGAITRRLTASNAKVAIWDIDADASALMKKQLGSSVEVFEADISNETSVAKAMANTIDWSGVVHGLVNSAGIAGPNAPLADYPIDAWRQIMQINVDGTFLTNRAVVPLLQAQGYGRIVNIASVAGKEGNPGLSPYNTSKAGMIGFVKGIAKEVAPHGIVINSLAPAVISTPMNSNTSEETLKYMISRIPMGRVGQPEEVAEIVAFMASKACSFTTGFTFDASGGRATY